MLELISKEFMKKGFVAEKKHAENYIRQKFCIGSFLIQDVPVKLGLQKLSFSEGISEDNLKG